MAAATTDDHRAGGGPELAVVGAHQAREVADDAEHEGVASGGVVGGRGEVGEQAGAEADEGAADVPVHEGEAEDDEQQQVGDGAGELEAGEDGDLDDEGDHDEGRGEQDPVEAHDGSAPTRLVAVAGRPALPACAASGSASPASTG